MTYLAPSRSRLFAAVLFAAGLLLFVSSARADDSVYWANFSSGTISFAGLAGGGGGDLDINGAIGAEANGLTIDAAAGKAYWVIPEGKVYYANLSGGGGGVLNTAGATLGFPLGLAIDPSIGRVFWSHGDKISYANLNGSGGGDLDTSGATVDGALSVTVMGGKVYWANSSGPDRVSYANVGGGGGGNLNLSGLTEGITALAFDPQGGRVYWSDQGNNKISYANLNGTGGGDLNTTGATVAGPWGVAIDPSAGRIYWSNEAGNKISYANLNGSGGADLDAAGATFGNPAFPVLLETPRAEAGPTATGKSKPGSTLTCTAGTWAPDLLESFLYRAPQTTSSQWLKNGQPISGATASTFKASAVGNYSCQSTATNHAGSATQTSASVAVFKLGKVTFNKKKGTATLAVQVPGAGTATLSGKTAVKQKAARKAGSAGTVKLLVKAKGKAKKTLSKKGKAKVKVTVGFSPTGGSAGSQTKTLTLKQAKPKKKK